MLPSMILLATLSLPQSPTPPQPNSRTIGIVPPFRAEPAPPEWLYATAHTVAAVDTRHYIYEAYAGPKHQWLVRFLMLPEAGEALRELEQAFLFDSDPKKKPLEVDPTEVTFDVRSATWKKASFALVDRRDLMKP